MRPTPPFFHWLASLSLLLFATALPAQSAPPSSAERAYLRQPIDAPDASEVWAGIGEGFDYSDPRRQQAPRRERPAAEGSDWDLPTWNGSIFPEGTRKVVRVMLFVLVIGLLTFLGYRLMGGVQLNVKRATAQEDLYVEVERLSSDLVGMDINGFAERALAQADYRLAIRLYFLQVLQILTEQKHIRWKKDKTNRAYLQELRDHPEREAVQRITLLFERAWYGGGTVDAAAFERAEAQFKPLLHRLQSAG